MTQAEKLEALVRRAVEGGWTRHEKLMKFLEDAVLNDYHVLETDNDHQVHVFAIIYQHDFARALFGSEPFHILGVMGMAEQYRGELTNIQEVVSMTNSEYHLQQAVISNDPIDYMYEAVFGE